MIASKEAFLHINQSTTAHLTQQAVSILLKCGTEFHDLKKKKKKRDEPSLIIPIPLNPVQCTSTSPVSSDWSIILSQYIHLFLAGALLFDEALYMNAAQSNTAALQVWCHSAKFGYVVCILCIIIFISTGHLDSKVYMWWSEDILSSLQQKNPSLLLVITKQQPQTYLQVTSVSWKNVLIQLYNKNFLNVALHWFTVYIKVLSKCWALLARMHVKIIYIYNTVQRQRKSLCSCILTPYCFSLI